MKKQVKIAAAKKITVRQVFNHTASPVDKFCLGVTSERSWTKTKNLNFTEQNDLFFFNETSGVFFAASISTISNWGKKIVNFISCSIILSLYPTWYSVWCFVVRATNKLENEIKIFVGDTAKFPLFVDLIFPVTESAQNSQKHSLASYWWYRKLSAEKFLGFHNFCRIVFLLISNENEFKTI